MLRSYSESSQGKFLGSEAHHIWVIENQFHVHVDHHIVVKAWLTNHAYSLYVVKRIALVQLIVQLFKNSFLHQNHIDLCDGLLQLGQKFSDLIVVGFKILWGQMVGADEDLGNAAVVHKALGWHAVENVYCKEQGFLRELVIDRPLNKIVNALSSGVDLQGIFVNPVLRKESFGLFSLLLSLFESQRSTWRIQRQTECPQCSSGPRKACWFLVLLNDWVFLWFCWARCFPLTLSWSWPWWRCSESQTCCQALKPSWGSPGVSGSPSSHW